MVVEDARKRRVKEEKEEGKKLAVKGKLEEKGRRRRGKQEKSKN